MVTTKKITLIAFALIAAATAQSIYLGVKKHKAPAPTPEWITKLEHQISKEFKTPVTLSEVYREDNLDYETYQMYRLEATGSLSNVTRPFEDARDVFLESSSDGGSWQEDYKYSAGGHDSASFGFRRSNKLCLSSISVGSGDKNTDSKNQSNQFSLSVDCREIVTP